MKVNDKEKIVLDQENFQIIPFSFDENIQVIIKKIKEENQEIQKQINDLIKEKEDKLKEAELYEEKKDEITNSINKKRNKIINPINEEINKKRDEIKWNFKNSNGRHLFTYINKLISSENISSRIGTVLELNLNNDKCERLGIYNNSQVFRSIYKENKSKVLEYLFKYNFINVYLFETGIGFLVYSIKFFDKENEMVKNKLNLKKSKVSITDIINGNYYFKKYDETGVYENYRWEIEYETLKKAKNNEKLLDYEHTNNKSNEKIKERINKSDEKIKRLEDINELYGRNRTKLVQLIISDLNLGNTSFITSEEDPNYSHVFTYINLDQNISNEEINKYMFLLKNSYKESYKGTEEILKYNNDKNNLQLFENIWWGGSIEGLTCISRHTNDEDTNEFIDTYNGNIASNYLYMYILMLHMRYALLKYITDATQINKEVKNYGESDINNINELKEKIILLDLRCIFNDVSNISSQVKVFDMMRDVLRIDRLSEELYKEIENLSVLASLYYKKKLTDKEIREREEEEIREKKKSESLEAIYYVLGALAVSGFIRDIIEILGNPYQWIYFILITISILVLILIYGNIKKKN